MVGAVRGRMCANVATSSVNEPGQHKGQILNRVATLWPTLSAARLAQLHTRRMRNEWDLLACWHAGMPLSRFEFISFSTVWPMISYGTKHGESKTISH